jgi:hypothetical protein
MRCVRPRTLRPPTLISTNIQHPPSQRVKSGILSFTGTIGGVHKEGKQENEGKQATDENTNLEYKKSNYVVLGDMSS